LTLKKPKGDKKWSADEGTSTKSVVEREVRGSYGRRESLRGHITRTEKEGLLQVVGDSKKRTKRKKKETAINI